MNCCSTYYINKELAKHPCGQRGNKYGTLHRRYHQKRIMHLSTCDIEGAEREGEGAAGKAAGIRYAIGWAEECRDSWRHYI